MDMVVAFLEKAKLAKKQQHENMTVFPLLAADGFAPDYMVRDQAIPDISS